jgi:hypothetical protein
MTYTFNKEIAIEHGVNVATFLNNLAFWINQNNKNNINNRDGFTYSYQTQSKLSDILPFSIDQIKRLVKKLKDAGIIRVEQFNKSRYDRTNWYTIVDEKVSQLLGLTKKIFKNKKFEIVLDESMIKQAQNLNISNKDDEFEKFVSFNKNKFKSIKIMKSKWLLWIKQAAKYINQQNKRAGYTKYNQIQEKAAYKWDFRKAKDISDKIKDWLTFDAKVKWRDLYYYQDINPFSINAKNGNLTIYYKDVMHPDFNKKETILYMKNESGKSDIIDVELLS